MLNVAITMNTFQEIVLEWINCFPFLERPFAHYTDLEGVDIVGELLQYANQICLTQDSKHQPFVGIDDFLARKYPQFKESSNDDHEFLSYIGMFIHYFFFVDVIREKMFNLSTNFQVKIQQFLTIIMAEENITKELVVKAIMTISEEERFSPGTPRFKSSPLYDTVSPLQNFYQSPLTQRYRSPYNKQNKSRDNSGQQLKFIKEDLEDMTAENEKLQALVLELKEEKAKLSRKVQSSNHIIEELNDQIQQMSQNTVVSCARTCKEKIQQAVRERKDLEDYTKKLLEDVEDLQKEKSKLDQKIKTLEITNRREIQSIIDKHDVKLASFETALMEKDTRIRELQNMCEELKEMAKSSTHLSPIMKYNDSLSFVDEPLCRNPSTGETCAVFTDIILQEREAELLKVQGMVSTLKKELEQKDSQLAIINTENQSLQTTTLELQDKIDVLEELSNGLSNNFNCLKHEKEEVMSEKQFLDQQLKETILKFDELSAQYSELQKTLEELTLENDSVTTELLILQDQYSELQEENERHVLRIEQLVSAEKTYLKQISTYESELKAKEEESDKYLIQSRTLESKCLILEEACSVSEEKILSLESDLSKVKDSYNILFEEHTETKSKLDSAEKQKGQMMSELSSVAANFNSEIQHLRSEKESLQKDFDKLKQDFQGKIETGNELLDKYNKCSISLTEKEEENKILSSEVDTLKNNIKNLEESESILKTKLMEEANKNEYLYEENRQLDDKFRDSVKNTQELTDKLLTVSRKLESQSNEIAEKTVTINSLVEEINKLKLTYKDTVEKLEDAIQEKTKKITEYVSEIQVKESTVASIETTLTECNAKLKATADCVSRLEAVTTELELKLSETEKQLNIEKLSKQESDNRVQELEIENNKLTSHVEELTFELDCQKEELTSTTEKYSSEIEKLTSSVHVLEERISYLKEQVSELQSTCKNKQIDIDSKAAEIANLTNSVTTLKENLKEKDIEFENSITTVISEYKLKIEDMSNELSIILKEKNKLMEDLENEVKLKCEETRRYNEICVTLSKKEQEIEEIHVQLNMYSSQIHNFRTDMQELQYQLECEKKNKEALYAEMEVMKERIQVTTKDKEVLLSEMNDIKKSSLEETERLREEIVQREMNIEKLTQELEDLKFHFETESKLKLNEKIEFQCLIHTYEKTVLSLKNKIDDNVSEIDKLNTEVSTLNKLNDDLNCKLAADLEEYDCSVENLNNSVQKLESQVIILQKEKECLISELTSEKQNSDAQQNNLLSEIENLSTIISRYKCEDSMLKTEISELELKYKVACSELEEKINEIAMLSETAFQNTSQLENATSENERLHSDIRKLREDLKCKNELCNMIQTKYESCSNEVCKMRRLQDDLTATTNAYICAIGDLETNVKGLGNNLVNEKMKNDYLSMQYEELKNALASRDETIFGLNNELHNCNCKLNDFEVVKRELQEELQNEKCKYDCLIEERDKLKEVLSSDIENKDTALFDLTRQLNEQSIKFESLQDAKVELELELQNERYNILQKQQELESANADINKMEQTISNLNCLLNTHLKNMAVMEDRKNELEKLLTEEQYNNQLLTKEHEVIKDTLLEDIRAKAQTINNLNFELDSCKSSINELTKMKEGVEAHLVDERLKNASLLNEYMSIKESLGSEICDKTQTIKDLQLSLTNSEEMKEELKCKLEHVTGIMENSSKEMEQLNQDLNKLLKDKAKVEQQLSAVIEEKKLLQHEEKQLRNDIAEKDNRVSMLTDELNELKTKLNTEVELYQARLQESCSELSTSVKQIKDSNDQIFNLKEQIADYTEKLRNANSEIDLLEKINSDLSKKVSTVSELCAEKETMQNEMENLRTQLHSQQENFVVKQKNYDMEVENLKSSVFNTEKECNNLKIKVSALEMINKNSASELGEKNSEINRLSNSLLKLQDTIKENELQFEKNVAEIKAVYESDIYKFREENIRLTSQVEKLINECDVKNKLVSELSGQIYLLEEKLQCEKTRNDSLEKENASLNKLHSGIEKSKVDIITNIKSFISVEKSLSAKLENVNGYDNLQKAMKKFMSEYTRISDNCRKVLLNESLKPFDMNIIISLHNELSTLSITIELEHTSLLCEYISLMKENISWCERNILKLLYSSGIENINLEPYIQEHKNRISSQINKVELQIVNLTTKCAEGLSKCKVLISHCIPIIMDSLSSNETPTCREFSELEEDGWNTEDILERNVIPKNVSSNLETLENLQKENISLKFKVNDLEKSKADLKKKVEQMKSLVDGKTEQTEFLTAHARSSETFLQRIKEENSVKIQDLQNQLDQVNAEKQKLENDHHQKLETMKVELHDQYNKKLDRCKQKMLEVVNKNVEAQLKESSRKLKESETKLKEKDRQFNDLEREMKKLQKTLQQVERQRQQYYKECVRLKGEENRTSFLSRDSFTPVKSSRSEETLYFREKPREPLSTIDERLSNRRSSIFASKENSKHFFWPAVEDEGDEFNSKFLDDLTAGRCDVELDKRRLTELKMRNSLCPPHLKSSYPAETQFHNLVEFTEDDLKLGSTVDVDPTTSLLRQSDRHRKKEKSTYSKPGPPTPGKHGGRASLQGLENTPRHALVEKNDQLKKQSTPGQYIRNLFTRSGRQDENCPSPGKSLRRSIFKKQRN